MIHARRRLTILVLAFATLPALAARPKPAQPTAPEARWEAWQQHRQMEQASPFHGVEYRAIGPVVQGGRIVDLATVPDAPYTFYVAYASGGLWKTTNNGVTFEPIFDDQPTMIMGDIAVDPNHPQRVWVGTGEPNSSRSSYGGMGVFRSDDGGETWSHVGLEGTDRISRILIDPRDSNTIYVAALGKLYTPGGQRGVFRSTDGGESWSEILPGGEWTGAIDLVFKPDDPSTLYAATWERKRRPWNFWEGGEGSAVWKSTDGGDHWTKLAGGFPQGETVGRIGLAVSAAAPDSVYAVVDNQEILPEDQWELGDRPINPKRLRNMTREEFLRQDPDEVEQFIRDSDFPVELDAKELLRQVEAEEVSLDDILDELSDANANLFNTDIQGLQVWRSDDGGESWRKTHEDPLDEVAYTYGYYFGQMRVSPTDPDEMYVLGVPIVKSTDGGESWTNVNEPQVHVDHHALWINPEHPQHLMLGNDGGLDVSFDGGKSWLKLDAQPVGQFYTVNVDMAEPYNVYGGLQDNGTMKCSSTNDWTTGPNCQRIGGGDGMYVAIDPRDNETVFSGYQFGYYTRKDNKGRTEVRPRDHFGDDEPALRYNWNTPVVLSPHNPEVVYFGTNQLYRSMDQGKTWSPISADVSNSKERGDVPFATITTISESPLAFGLIWVGTDDGELWLTESGGHRWVEGDDRLPRDRWVSRVEASRHARDRAYVSLNGYRDDDDRAYVYRTDDLGKRWKDISQGLPSEPVNVIREDPLVENLLYVGTDRGVYVSMNGGESWEALDSGLPNVPVHDLIVHPRDRELVAGTHGRSVWIADVLPVQELAESGRDAAVDLYYIDPVQAERGWRSERSRWWDREKDRPDVTMYYWAKSDGTATFEVLDDEDRVLRTWDEEAKVGINQAKWDLLVEEDKALAAEQADLDAMDEPSDSLEHRRYAESIRLGHPLYVLPGDYTVKVTVGDESDTEDLEVKAPEAFEPRHKPDFEIRGRKDD